MATPLRLQLQILANGSSATVGELRNVRQAIADTSSESVKAAIAEEKAAQAAAAAASTRAKALRDAADAAKDAAQDAARAARDASPENKEAAKEAAKAARDAAESASRAARDAAKNATNLGVASVEASRRVKAVKEEEAQAAKLSAQANQSGLVGIAELAFRYNNVVGALQNLRATAQPVYDALIASNEKLNAQILSSQTNLASSTRIFKGDTEVTDPTAKIQASAGRLRAAIRQIEIDTQSLVGVTSAQVNELFQITLTNAGALNQQSKQFPDSISAATSLTKGWAASLKVVDIPLQQARQEINSIIKGQITQDSILAKNLNITNQQVEQWRSQGRLVDELNKKLDVFVAGNAIAARSIEGISSNIQDLGERIARNTGEPLFEPIIDVLAQIEQYLKKNEGAIASYLRGFAEGGADAIEGLKEFEPTFRLLEETIAQAAPIAQGLFNLLLEGSFTVGKAIQQNLQAILPILNKVLEGYQKIIEAIEYRNIADAIDAIKAYQQQTLGLADATYTTANALAELDRAKQANGKLTDEQIAKEKQLRANAQAQAEAIDKNIKALKEVRTYTAANAELRDNEIKALEALKARLDKATGGIVLQANSLEELGTTSEQFAKKLENAQRQIANEGGGDTAQFKEAAKQILSLAKTGVEAKQISVEAAREQLEAIKNNTKIELETQIAAKEAIDKLYDGRIAKIKELIEVGKLQADAGLDELGKIRDDETLEPVTRRKAAQQIVGIRKEQIAAETAAIATGQAQIAALQSQQRVSEARADEETTKLKIAELEKRAEATKVALENSTNETDRAKLKSELEKDGAEREKIEAELESRRRKRAIEDFDERRTLIKAQNDLGLIDRYTYNRQIALNDLAQNDTAIAQQKQALAKLSGDDKQGREAINSEIAKLQSKRIEIVRGYDEQELKQRAEYYEQELTALKTARAQGLLADEEFAIAQANNRLAQADGEIEVLQRQLARLGEADIEGRNAISAKILDLEAKKIGSLDELYQKQLTLLKEAQERANALLSQAQIEREIGIRDALNRQAIAIEDGEDRKLESSRRAVAEQLELAKKQEAELAKLANSSRSPEAEKAYQREVMAARTNVARLTLQLLEQEGQAIERGRSKAIKAIEDEVAARNRAADAQLSQIDTLKAARTRATTDSVAGFEREVAALNRLNQKLDLQNSLTKARADLAKSLREATATGDNIEVDKLKQAIDLIKQLESGNLSGKERLIIQQQLAALTGNNTQSIYELTVRQKDLENKIAEDKKAALKAEQEQARAQLLLDQQRNDLALRRSAIEAKIAETKAKQGLLDAEDNLRQERINAQKSIDAGRAEVQKAEQLPRGRERDRQLADARSRLALAESNAAKSTENAEQSVGLAREQVGLAREGVAQIAEQQKQQVQINKLQSDNLILQQQTATKQQEAADSARRFADELSRAKLEMERLQSLGVNLNVETPKLAGQRANGGNVARGRSYLVGENSPEIFVPGESGTILNRQQILKGLRIDASPAPASNGDVVRAIADLKQSIASRPAQIVNQVAFGSPSDSQFEDYVRMQRSVARGSF